LIASVKRARFGLGVLQIVDRQRTAGDSALRPAAAGGMEGGSACGRAKDLR
jgi:hypothetical protein